MAILKDISLPLDKSVWMLINTEKCTELAHLVRTANEIIDLAYDHDVTALAEDNIKVADQIKDLLHDMVKDDQPTFVLYNKVKKELLVLPIDYSSDMDEDDLDLSGITDYAVHRLPPVSKYTEQSEKENNKDAFMDSALNDANPNKFAGIDREITKMLTDNICTEDQIKQHFEEFLSTKKSSVQKLRVDKELRIWTNTEKEVVIGKKPKSVFLWILSYSEGIKKTALSNKQDRDKLWNIFYTLTGKGQAAFEQFIDILQQDGLSYNKTNINKAIDIAFYPESAQKFNILNLNKKLSIPAVQEGLIIREDNLEKMTTLE